MGSQDEISDFSIQFPKYLENSDANQRLNGDDLLISLIFLAFNS